VKDDKMKRAYSIIMHFNYYIIASSTLRLWKGESFVDSNFVNFVELFLTSSLNITMSQVYIALLYINQLSQRLRSEQRKEYSEYRIFITALMLADSTCNDACIMTITWSKLSGIPTSEIIGMRKEFLEKLDYRIHVPEQMYNGWAQCLELMIASYHPGSALVSMKYLGRDILHLSEQSYIINYPARLPISSANYLSNNFTAKTPVPAPFNISNIKQMNGNFI
jgi:hypothetical protein